MLASACANRAALLAPTNFISRGLARPLQITRRWKLSSAATIRAACWEPGNGGGPSRVLSISGENYLSGDVNFLQAAPGAAEATTGNTNTIPHNDVGQIDSAPTTGRRTISDVARTPASGIPTPAPDEPRPTMLRRPASEPDATPAHPVIVDDGVLSQAELDYLRRRRDRALERGRPHRRADSTRWRRCPSASPTWPGSISARSRRRRSRSMPTPPATAGTSTPPRATTPSSATRFAATRLQTDPDAGAGRALRPAHHRHARDGPRARPGGPLRRGTARDDADVRLAVHRRAAAAGRRARPTARSRARSPSEEFLRRADRHRRAAGRQDGRPSSGRRRSTRRPTSSSSTRSTPARSRRPTRSASPTRTPTPSPPRSTR